VRVNGCNGVKENYCYIYRYIAGALQILHRDRTESAGGVWKDKSCEFTSASAIGEHLWEIALRSADEMGRKNTLGYEIRSSNHQPKKREGSKLKVAPSRHRLTRNTSRT